MKNFKLNSSKLNWRNYIEYSNTIISLQSFRSRGYFENLHSYGIFCEYSCLGTHRNIVQAETLLKFMDRLYLKNWSKGQYSEFESCTYPIIKLVFESTRLVDENSFTVVNKSNTFRFNFQAYLCYSYFLN